VGKENVSHRGKVVEGGGVFEGGGENKQPDVGGGRTWEKKNNVNRGSIVGTNFGRR